MYGGIPAITTQDPGVAAQALDIYYGTRSREDRDSDSGVTSIGLNSLNFQEKENFI